MILVDANQTIAWQKLQVLADRLIPDLRGWFADDRQRAAKLSFEAGELFCDLSKNLITPEILDALIELAEQVGVSKRRDEMFAGEKINVTEGRSVLHTALRLPKSAELEVAGQNVVHDVHEVLRRMFSFAEQVRSGQWRGVTGRRIETIVNIGIGGSDLGPVMVYEALLPYKKPGLECRFVSNIDPSDIYEKVADLNPETTLFIVASKTFTTLETLTNARLAKAWLLRELHERNVADDVESVAKHFVAVSTALDKVAEFGIDPNNAFGFWDWVGGRYSVDSAVGLSLAIALGPDNFTDFLHGFRAIDEHFLNTDLDENVPVLMGMLNIWYVNFLGAHSHVILPYSQYLHRFPAYLQQLTMESNGKSVRLDGSPVNGNTGEIFWGEPGTNGQHAFYQLIHQGTRLIPADFIAVANPARPLKDGDVDVHGLLLANFFAQSAALAFGKTSDEVRAEGTAERLVSARVFPGNRPSTSILAPTLTPSVVGQLIALYEHITFVQGVVWGIDSFDQWGVELGKKLALQIAPAVFGDEDALVKQDPSTASLVSWYRSHRSG